MNSGIVKPEKFDHLHLVYHLMSMSMSMSLSLNHLMSTFNDKCLSVLKNFFFLWRTLKRFIINFVCIVQIRSYKYFVDYKQLFT